MKYAITNTQTVAKRGLEKRVGCNLIEGDLEYNAGEDGKNIPASQIYWETGALISLLAKKKSLYLMDIILANPLTQLFVLLYFFLRVIILPINPAATFIATEFLETRLVTPTCNSTPSNFFTGLCELPVVSFFER
jgi:hypothetical protein